MSDFPSSELVFKMHFKHIWHFLLVASVFAIFLSSGCTLRTGQDGSGPPAVLLPGMEGVASISISDTGQSRLSRIDIIPRHAILPAGETIVFSAVVYDQSGKALPTNEVEARWRVTDSIVGTISTTGVFRAGLQRGVFSQSVEVNISHQLNGKIVTLQALASVSVVQPLSDLDISQIYILPGHIQVEPGSQVELAALALDRDGIPVPGVGFLWEILDYSAGNINTNGHFTSGQIVGVFPDAIRVVGYKLKDPSQSATTTARVDIRARGETQPPTKVNLYPGAVSLRAGDTLQFRAMALDPQGNLVEDVKTSWALRDKSVGLLTPEGKFQAGLRPGTYPDLIEVTISPLDVTHHMPLQATATVTILESITGSTQLDQLLITPQVVRLRPGESVRLTATAMSRSGVLTPVEEAHWSVEEEVATLNSDGLLFAGDKPGFYKNAIKVTVTAGNEEKPITKINYANVIILGPLARVEIIPRQMELSPKQVVQFTYIAFDVNDIRLFDVSGTWEVSDELAGSINNIGLFIAGKTPGEYSDVIKVTVRPLSRY